MLPFWPHFSLELGVWNPNQERSLFFHHLSTVFSPTLVHPPKRAFSDHLQHVVLFHDRGFGVPQKEVEMVVKSSSSTQFHTSGKPGWHMEGRFMLATLLFPLFHNNPGLRPIEWSEWEDESLEQIERLLQFSLLFSLLGPQPNLAPTYPPSPFPLHPFRPPPSSCHRQPPQRPRPRPRPHPLHELRRPELRFTPSPGASSSPGRGTPALASAPPPRAACILCLT